ncbi:hypothetical protein [Streptomyces sp. MP131-18]|uniref:hypothetical protein n=1 Tax=Streptomyces sp. MP131-18 TaxID=1857892 RepID=UPI0011810139|nr:hypothetical protein [Streptomyces sp. MP131-18]
MAFDIPESFARTPVGMTEDEVRAHATARLRDGADGADGETLREVLEHSQRLREAGTLYCGSFLGELDAELSLATLMVNVVEFPYGDDPRLATEGMAQSLSAARGPQWAGGLYELPCGQPACVLTGPVVYQSPDVEPDEVAYTKLQAFVPVPETSDQQEQLLLVVDFGSPSRQHWERYMEVPARLLRSLSFAEADSKGPEHG